MSNERRESQEETTETETDQEVSETPELVPSNQQLRDHQPDAYTSGYDPFGETRVGIGTARGKLKRLIRLNEGRHQSDGSHSAREAARDKKRITESLCSALDVTTYQQRRAISAMSQMNLDRFGQQNRSKRLGSVQLASSWIGIEGTIFFGRQRSERHRFLRSKPAGLSR